jgi:hypothetical protein
MSYVRIPLLSAAAACLPPFSTLAIAGLGHPTGCVSCPPIEITSPTEDSFHEGAPAIGPALNMAFPPGATALTPAGSVGGHPLAKRRHWQVRDPREHHTVRP